MRWIVRLGVPVVRLLGWTWRIRIINAEASVARLRGERRPIVFALWHGDMLALLYQHRGEGVSVLISEHRDGELIARVAESLGFRTVRGSTTRGASRALVGLARELRDGHDIAVTPDGPRGPARSFAPGALIAAQRARRGCGDEARMASLVVGPLRHSEAVQPGVHRLLGSRSAGRRESAGRRAGDVALPAADAGG